MALFPEYESYDAIGLAHLIERRIISPKDLLEVAIDRIETHNPSVNAVIYKMYDEAHRSVRKGLPKGIFHGVPFLLKDLLADYAGVPLSSGSRFTADWKPAKDSELVKRFKQAGLVTVGKTNVPEFGLNFVTEPALFGPTRNPWHLDYSAGGSSGGSAAAVACGMVPMAHANDGGGSIRIPASYCGLFGLKPSRGRTSVGSEMMRMWENMVAEHVLTRTVRDSAAMLDVLCGPEDGIIGSLPKPAESYLKAIEQPPEKLQIAFTDQPFFAAEVSDEYKLALTKTTELLEDMGHQVEMVSLQIDSSDVSRAYIIVIAGEVAASIKRFSEALGHKPSHRDLERQTAVVAHIGEHVSAADFAWAGGVLENATRHMMHFFKDYDVLLTPTMPCAPPRIGALNPDVFEQGMLELVSHVPFAPLLHKAIEYSANKNFAYYPFTPVFNITGQPAMSVPLHIDEKGLPIGMQFAARYGEEQTLLRLAKQLETRNPWFNVHPTQSFQSQK